MSATLRAVSYPEKTSSPGVIAGAVVAVVGVLLLNGIAVVVVIAIALR